MKEYEFVRVELSSFNRRPKEDYQQIIHDYAGKGWRVLFKFSPQARPDTDQQLILN